MKFRLASIAILAVIVLAGCKKNQNPQVDFIVAPLKSGSDVKLSSDYKDKPVVVYLWATWCGPCKQFAPALNGLADQYKPKGVEFLAISNETAKVVSVSELREPHRMTVLLDPYASASEALQSTSLPTIMILDKEHRAIWGSRGIGSTTEADMKAALDTLI